MDEQPRTPESIDLALHSRAAARWLVAAAAVLALTSTAGFLYHEHEQALSSATALSARRVSDLADELRGTLDLAQVALSRLDAKLAALPSAAATPEVWSAANADIAAVLSRLPLPVRIDVLGVDGHVLEGLGLPARTGVERYSVPSSDTWQVEPTRSTGGRRVVPLLRRAATRTHGVAGFLVTIDHQALVRRFDGSRESGGGGAALFRIAADGSTELLARAPLREAELGQRVRGPLAAALAQAPAGTFVAMTQLDHTHRLVAYQRLDGPAAALVVGYGMATATVLAPWRSMLYWGSAAGFLLVLAITTAGLRLDRALRAQADQRRALLRSESQFRALADNLPDVVVRLDREGRYLHANAALLQATGLRPEACIGKTCAEVGLPEETVNLQRELLRKVFEQGRVQRQEFTYVGPNGVRQWESLAALEPATSGAPATALVISRDITERKETESALRRSELRFRLAASTGQVWEWSSGDRSAKTVNEFLATLGLEVASDTEALAAFQAAVDPDDLLAMQQALRRHFRRQGPYRVEFGATDADGRKRWFETQGQAVWNDDGRAVYMAGTTFEITERRAAQDQVRQLAAELEQRVAERTAQLARSEALYRTIFETVPVSISEQDWSGVQTLLRDLRRQGVVDGPAYFAAHPDFVLRCLRAVGLLRSNQQALALNRAHGQPDAVTGLEPLFSRREDLTLFVGEIEALWSGRRLVTARRSMPSPDGRRLNLMMTMSLPALDDDDGTALVCLADITEIDDLNAELDRHVRRLRQTNQELETFTYTVSHDLKAPLRGIDGYSRLLLTDHHDQLDAEGREFLDHIRQATQQMGMLIDDLLSYSRLERRDPNLATVPLVGLVDSVLAGFRQDFAAAGVQLEIRVGADLQARADAQGLTMALRNLLDNAFKFSRTSAPPRIVVEAERCGSKLQLRVRDNGIGFEMKFHDRIFSIFQRLHRAEHHAGTGIGLAIVAKAMERMGGRAWALSAPGAGATFTLELAEARSA